MRWFWKLIYFVANPVLAVTGAAWAVRFHDWAMEKAWPTPDKLALFDALREAQQIAEEAGNEPIADSLNTLALLWSTGREAEAQRVLDPLAAELLEAAGLGEIDARRKIAERVAAQFPEEKREIAAGYEEAVRLSAEEIEALTAKYQEELRQHQKWMESDGDDSVEREIREAERRERRGESLLTPGRSDGAVTAPSVDRAGFRFGNRLLAWLDRNGAWIIEPFRLQLRSLAAELDADGAMQVENQRGEREMEHADLRRRIEEAVRSRLSAGDARGVQDVINGQGLLDELAEIFGERSTESPWQPIAAAVQLGGLWGSGRRPGVRQLGDRPAPAPSGPRFGERVRQIFELFSPASVAPVIYYITHGTLEEIAVAVDDDRNAVQRTALYLSEERGRLENELGDLRLDHQRVLAKLKELTKTAPAAAESTPEESEARANAARSMGRGDR